MTQESHAQPSIDMKRLVLMPACLDDLDAVHQLESQSYHPDEAASREQLRNRLCYASQSGQELFMKAYHGETLIGFLCSTLASTPLVTDESMRVHEPQGRTICLHSVCVETKYRRQGVAAGMLKQWIAGLPLHKYERIALISRPHLVPLYQSVGFHNLGKSEVVHGPDPWYDCVIDLEASQATE